MHRSEEAFALADGERTLRTLLKQVKALDVSSPIEILGFRADRNLLRAILTGAVTLVGLVRATQHAD